MTINWFPGHMHKARLGLAKYLLSVDVVIELLDARLPASSSNPMLDSLRGDKPKLVVLTKADLADPDFTKRWIAELSKAQGSRVIAVDTSKSHTFKKLPQLCRQLAPDRTTATKPLRAMVVGIPNVGKSTLINILLGRRDARVGDRPAITRKTLKYHLGKDFSLSDTPGVLWPKLDDQDVAYKLAMSGAIRETAFDYLDVARYAVDFLVEHYPEALVTRFKLPDPTLRGDELLESVGRRRGFLKRGGIVDVERTATTLLHEMRAGKMGRMSFDTPPAPVANPGPADETAEP